MRKMTNKIIYLECPYCEHRILKSMLIGNKWNPSKMVTCPKCDCDSELSEWNWYEKMTIIHFREMSSHELEGILV